MDPLVHALVGVAIGLLWRRPEALPLARRLLVAVVAATVSDIGLLAGPLRGHPAEVFEMWAMGHSLLGTVTAGAAIAFIATRDLRVIPLGVVAALSHPALDCFSAFRPMLLSPFDDPSVGLPSVAWGDPIAWLSLAVPLALAGLGKLDLRRGAIAALGALALWIGASALITTAAEAHAGELAVAEGMTPTRVVAWPTGPLTRSVGVFSDDRVGHVSVSMLDPPAALRDSWPHNMNDPAVVFGRATTLGTSFQSWADAVYARIGYANTADSKVLIEFRDLRFEHLPPVQMEFVGRLRMRREVELGPEVWKEESWSWRARASAAPLLGVDKPPREPEPEDDGPADDDKGGGAKKK